MATTAAIHLRPSEFDTIGALGAAGTALLWCSVVSYTAQWWHGMAVFIGGTTRLSFYLFWPAVTLMVLIVASAQMLYTLNLSTAAAQEDCDSIIGGRALCNVRDAFTIVYLLLIGTPLIESGDADEDSLSKGTIGLIVAFVLLFILLVINLLISVVVWASRLNPDEIAVHTFWAPKLTFFSMAAELLPCMTPASWKELVSATSSKDYIRGKTARMSKRPRWEETSTSGLERFWDIVVRAGFGEDRNRNLWYVGFCSMERSLLITWPLRMCALLLIPIWLAVGLATLGILWPPQVRRWLFSTRAPGLNEDASFHGLHPKMLSAAQVTAIRSELLKLKTMSYQKSNDLQGEIRELKELLLSSMKE